MCCQLKHINHCSNYPMEDSVSFFQVATHFCWPGRIKVSHLWNTTPVYVSRWEGRLTIKGCPCGCSVWRQRGQGNLDSLITDCVHVWKERTVLYSLSWQPLPSLTREPGINYSLHCVIAYNLTPVSSLHILYQSTAKWSQVKLHHHGNSSFTPSDQARQARYSAQ